MKKFYSVFVLLIYSVFSTAQDSPVEVSDSLSSKITHGAEIATEDFNKGFITTPEELFLGKVTGLQVIQGDGSPGSKFELIIRGKSSLLNDNYPLIVLDGMPLIDVKSIQFINPNDIESVNVLKDVASSVKYGKFARNGVVEINLKKSASDKISANVNSSVAVNNVSDYRKVLDADRYRSLINEREGADVSSILGNANTNWQDALYSPSVSHKVDANISSTFEGLPVYLSMSSIVDKGTISHSDYKRKNVSLTLNPKFFKDHLEVAAGANYSLSEQNRIYNRSISTALEFNPTIPVYDLNGDYNHNSSDPKHYYSLNPLYVNENFTDVGKMSFINTKLGFKYNIHGFEELAISSNLYYSERKSNTDVRWNKEVTEFSYYNDEDIDEGLINRMFDIGLLYNKNIESINSCISFSAKYSRHILSDEYSYIESRDELVSFQNSYSDRFMSNWNFNLSYSLLDKYFVEAVYHIDELSLLGGKKSNVSSYGFSAGWDIAKEGFMKNNGVINDLVYTISYGQLLNPFVIYSFGAFSNTEINLEKRAGFTTSVKFSTSNNKVRGKLEYYNESVDNLFFMAPIISGTGYSSSFLESSGTVHNKGVELHLNYDAITNNTFAWNMGLNLARNINKISDDFKYEIVDASWSGFGPQPRITAGGSIGEVYALDQIYDSNNKPIEEAYVLDNDGYSVMVESGNVNPDVTIGLSNTFKYKSWELYFSGRTSIGNSVYNSFDANGALRYLVGNTTDEEFYNISENTLETGFEGSQRYSNYFVEKASFFRMDFINLSYIFEDITKYNLNVKLDASVNNAFVLSNYRGVDPEHASGVDGADFYLRPRVFSFGLNIGI
ncbi:MAG: TonB-dependent receptor plug domain-containing protein [Bacteroidota bacterium]